MVWCAGDTTSLLLVVSPICSFYFESFSGCANSAKVWPGWAGYGPVRRGTVRRPVIKSRNANGYRASLFFNYIDSIVGIILYWNFQILVFVGGFHRS